MGILFGKQTLGGWRKLSEEQDHRTVFTYPILSHNILHLTHGFKKNTSCESCSGSVLLCLLQSLTYCFRVFRCRSFYHLTQPNNSTQKMVR
mmetsp:Transcript_86844/g.176823  ORF Transcript_86844/g.176823 Transcript_86844/m.176823 type:complete len:91 (+) Transcript_86844:1862-2134(+)